MVAVNNIDGLIEVLLDPNARADERDDAASELGEADSDRGLEVLVKVGSDATADETVLASCGESIGQIWVRRGLRDRESWDALQPATRSELQAYLKARQPDWLDDDGQFAYVGIGGTSGDNRLNRQTPLRSIFHHRPACHRANVAVSPERDRRKMKRREDRRGEVNSCPRGHISRFKAPIQRTDGHPRRPENGRPWCHAEDG